jgi:hypothetical protein
MKKIFLTTSAALLLFATSCDDFGDTNVNPNASAVPLTSALLTNAESALGGATTGGSALISGYYAQYFTQTQYTENSRYAVQDADWGGELAGSIKDLQTIIDINRDPKTAPIAATRGANSNQIAIARILKAFRFSVLTDRYGDMPYTDALKGNTQPAFDTQQAIYTDLFKELKEATAQFDDAGITVQGDFLFGGQPAKWRKFANSLRLILALRISKVDATKGQSEFNDALTAGVFESNDDNVIVPYPGGNFKNPWFGLAADFGITNTMADYLGSVGDLRKNAYGKPASNGTLVGVPFGRTRDFTIQWVNANSSWSKVLNDNWRDEKAALPILTYADVLLARAEALQLGWTAANTKETMTVPNLYKEGIRASWKQWGVYTTDAAFDTYMANANIDLATGNALPKIQTQRWVTFYPNAPQGWSEWRRTGQPALVASVDAVNPSKQIPVRFVYPSLEFGYNETHVQEAVGRLSGGNTDVSPVWWDK